jgi:hypothetical protein
MERRAVMIKTAHLTLDALGMMAVKTTYDEQLVALIREIPGQRRRWSSERRVWLIDAYYYDYLMTVLKELNYAITDEVTAGAVVRRAEDEPGAWLLACTPGVRPMRVQCPVCQQIRAVGCHHLYEDATGIKRAAILWQRVRSCLGAVFTGAGWALVDVG